MSTRSDDDDAASRRAILARRRRFVALALTGVATAVGATACVCLSPPDTGTDAGPPDAARDAADPDGSP